jgi:glycerol-3-phosphate dehydrogenase subunit B
MCALLPAYIPVMSREINRPPDLTTSYHNLSVASRCSLQCQSKYEAFMDDILVIGAGPAGLLAAWVARQRGAKVKVLASGIGTTHVSPGWIGVLHDQAPGASLESWIAAHPDHPYALAGLDALRGGLAGLREVCAQAGLSYVGALDANFRLPTALGAVAEAAVVPESFAAGDLSQPGAMLIAGPADWRDFYPKLCADNLARQGFPVQAVTFDLPEMHTSKFDATPVGLARLFDRADVRERVAAQLKPKLNGATRAGFPAVLGLECLAKAWRDLSDRLGVPVFEIPTLPPSVPGMRLFSAFKAALTLAGVQILLDMTAVRGVVEGGRATGVVVPNVVRDQIYPADMVILATGGLYGGGITTDYTGAMRETVFDLPLYIPGETGDWFEPQFLGEREHPIHHAGVRVNALMQPVDESGRAVLEDVRVAGRLLASYNPLAEGSTEGVWLATAFRAATADHRP